jgi:hypothetical protein
MPFAISRRMSLKLLEKRVCLTIAAEAARPCSGAAASGDALICIDVAIALRWGRALLEATRGSRLYAVRMKRRVQKNPGLAPGETGEVNPAGEFDERLLSTTHARINSVCIQ